MDDLFATPSSGLDASVTVAPPAPDKPADVGVGVNPAPAAAPAQPMYLVPPARPLEGQVSTIRKRTIAGIAGASLVLGALGGAGTYAVLDAISDETPQIPVAAPGSAETPIGAPTNQIAGVVAAAMPSVVQIEVTSDGSPASTGSGFVIREDGYILTNNHVIDQPKPGVTVIFSDGSEETAEIVGSTADYDLAVLKVGRTGLPALTFGDSDAVIVGDPVIAIGSPLGLDSTVTTGIISALHRPVTTRGQGAQAFIDALQTDAAINPGNSGGPLLNARGEVIGVNSAVAALPGATRSSGAGSVGLGFAIPSNQALRTAQQLIETGVATYPVIGVLLDGSYVGEGIKVAETDEETGQPGVIPGGPADRAGIREGDIILTFEGRPVTTSDSLIVGIRAKAPGDTVVFTIKRGGVEREISVTLTSSDQVDFFGDEQGDGGDRVGGESD